MLLFYFSFRIRLQNLVLFNTELVMRQFSQQICMSQFVYLYNDIPVT